MKNENTDILEKMHRVQMLLHRYQAHGMHNFGPRNNPHRGQGRVLSLLKLQPSISQKDLSYLLDMRQQSLSELLLKLEKNEYIVRTPSEKDKRITMITLTDAGRTAAADMEGKETGTVRIFDCLSEEEQKTFGEYLDRLAEALEKELGAFGPAGREAHPFGGMWEQGRPPFGGDPRGRFPDDRREGPFPRGRGFGPGHARGGFDEEES